MSATVSPFPTSWAIANNLSLKFIIFIRDNPSVFAPAWMTELSQGFGFYLPYPLSCDIKFFSYFFKGPGPAVFQAETQLQYFLPFR